MTGKRSIGCPAVTHGRHMGTWADGIIDIACISWMTLAQAKNGPQGLYPALPAVGEIRVTDDDNVLLKLVKLKLVQIFSLH